MKNIGLNLYSLSDFTQTKTGLAQTLERVGDMGYQGVQISGITGLQPEEISRVVETSGLPVAATHTSWDLFLNDPARAIEIHRLYGCTHAAIGGLPKEYYSREGAKHFCRELPGIIEGLRDTGIDFSYHNHSHELTKYENRTWLEWVFEESGSVGLNFEIDTYWIQAGGGDPTEWVKKCRGRIPLLHLKDMCVTPDKEQRFAPVGDGNLEWTKILQAAAESGVEWYLVEQDLFYEADPFTDIQRSCRFLLEQF